MAARILRTLLVAIMLGPAAAAAQVPVANRTVERNLAPPPPLQFRINTQSDAARAAFDRAYDRYLEMDLAGAAEGFAEAYALDPGLHLARAFELTVRGRAGAIADEVDRLHRLNGTPYLIESLQFVSMRERNRGRPVLANQVLAAAVFAAAADPRLRADYHLWLDRGSASRVATARALRDLDPGAWLYNAYVAVAITAPADSAEALSAMSAALRLGADRPYAHHTAAQLLATLGRSDEAVAHFGHALALDPRFANAAQFRGRELLRLGRYDEARRDFEAAAERSVHAPQVGLVRRAAALTHLHAGDIATARRAMATVIDQFEAENADRVRWATQLALAHAHAAVMAGAERDIAGVERHLAAFEAAQAYDRPTQLFWTVAAWFLAGEPARARTALTEHDGIAAPSPPMQAMVLAAEGRNAEAIAAAGTNTSAFAGLAVYRAHVAAGRTREADEVLQRLWDTAYAIDASAVPVARYLRSRD